MNFTVCIQSVLWKTGNTFSLINYKPADLRQTKHLHSDSAHNSNQLLNICYLYTLMDQEPVWPFLITSFIYPPTPSLCSEWMLVAHCPLTDFFLSFFVMLQETGMRKRGSSVKLLLQSSQALLEQVAECQIMGMFAAP